MNQDPGGYVTFVLPSPQQASWLRQRLQHALRSGRIMVLPPGAQWEAIPMEPDPDGLRPRPNYQRS